MIGLLGLLCTGKKGVGDSGDGGQERAGVWFLVLQLSTLGGV